MITNDVHEWVMISQDLEWCLMNVVYEMWHVPSYAIYGSLLIFVKHIYSIIINFSDSYTKGQISNEIMYMSYFRDHYQICPSTAKFWSYNRWFTYLLMELTQLRQIESDRICIGQPKWQYERSPSSAIHVSHKSNHIGGSQTLLNFIQPDDL